MSATVTVRGAATVWLDAERATLTVQIAHDGPEREPVFTATTAVAAEVTTVLQSLHGTAVTRWSADRVSVWSQRPWNDGGKLLAPVYHATLGMTARFQDFDALARFVEQFATTDGVTVASISWELSEQTHRSATAEVRAAAIRDATEKASAYAEAAGLGTVSPLAIADPGMLGDGAVGQPVPVERMAYTARAMSPADAVGTALSFTPDRIEVSAAVDARFTA